MSPVTLVILWYSNNMGRNWDALTVENYILVLLVSKPKYIYIAHSKGLEKGQVSSI